MPTIRGALFVVFLFAFSILYGVIAAPVLLVGRHQARSAAQLWCRCILFGLRGICGIRMRLEGAANLPEEGAPAIIAANHQSMWETLALYALLPNPVIILKQELLRIPIFNLWLMRVGNIAVDRAAGAQALRSLIKDADAAFADGAQIIIFPEGTRTPVGARRRLQPGVAALYAGVRQKAVADIDGGGEDAPKEAEKLGAPCIPVVHNSGRYWLTPGPAKTPGVITMRLLAPIPPGLSRKTFLKRLDTEMLAGRPDLPSQSLSEDPPEKKAANNAPNGADPVIS